MNPDQLIEADPGVSSRDPSRGEIPFIGVFPLPSVAGSNVDQGWNARTANWLSHGGAIGFTLVVLDVIFWAGLYTLLVSVRHHFAIDDPAEAAVLARYGLNSGGFQTSVFAVQFAALALCLYIVGGYDRRTSYLSLGYMSEHLIALAAAGVLGGLCIYAGAVFNESGIRPSRGVFLSSLMAFAPLSLICRRSLGQMLRAHMARSFLVVLGKGKSAAQFHDSYLVDGKHQPRLCFIDPLTVGKGTSADDHLSGIDGGPMSLESLARLAEKSRGVVVIEDTQRLRPELIEWLTRLHYAEVPVYTLETFHEKHWRRVAVDSINATWPWETESHLAGVSAYSHAKRLLDIVVAGTALLALSPLFAVLALLVWLDSGAPVFFSQHRVGRDRRTFRVYKFRTMRLRAPGEEGVALHGDERSTHHPRRRQAAQAAVRRTAPALERAAGRHEPHRSPRGVGTA